MEQTSSEGTKSQLTAVITSTFLHRLPATVEVLGQCINSQQRDNREAYQVTVITETKQQISILRSKTECFTVHKADIRITNVDLLVVNTVLRKSNHENISGICVCN